MSPRSGVLLLVALTLLTASCAKEADEPLGGGDRSSTTEPSGGTTTSVAGPDGFVPEPIEWDDCGGVECATLAVPLDYADPDGDTIEIYVARTRASGERYGALFLNPGGPGGSAAEHVDYIPTVLPDIAEHYDIVGMDPRGVGGSTPLSCGVDVEELYGVDPTIDSPADREALLEVSEEYVADCADKHADLLPHLGTRDVARDMDTVRAAMGDDKLSYLGYSYGTAIGQEYAALFPDRVDKMILDGLIALGTTGLQQAHEQALGFETALQRYVGHCDSAEECDTAGEALKAVEDVLALAEQPGGIPAPDADRPAGPGEANLGISYALYSESLWPQLDSALADALAGDGSALVDLADGYLGAAGFEVYFAVNCLDFAWPVGDADAFFSAAKATAAEAPHFGEALVLDYVRCLDWPVAPEPLTRVTAPGAPPILVVSTTGDPATPYEAGVAVADTLESGILITNEGDGHTVVGQGKSCIDDLVTNYLLNNEVPEDETTCN